jgi:flagellar basal-body rod modification protein FlgD
MDVGLVGSTAVSQSQSAQSDSFGGANLSISDFFQLFAAELQNQSMNDTVDNAQFMSQMVQFSMLSQMNEMTAAFQSNLAVSMIGKPVSVSTVDGQGRAQTVVGEVEQVCYSDGTPYLMVNGNFYALSDIADVGMQATEAADTNQ